MLWSQAQAELACARYIFPAVLFDKSLSEWGEMSCQKHLNMVNNLQYLQSQRLSIAKRPDGEAQQLFLFHSLTNFKCQAQQLSSPRQLSVWWCSLSSPAQLPISAIKASFKSELWSKVIFVKPWQNRVSRCEDFINIVMQLYSFPAHFIESWPIFLGLIIKAVIECTSLGLHQLSPLAWTVPRQMAHALCWSLSCRKKLYSCGAERTKDSCFKTSDFSETWCSWPGSKIKICRQSWILLGINKSR